MDVLCFGHLITLFCKLFASLYLVFLVLLSHYRPEVDFGWMMDNLDQKKAEYNAFGTSMRSS